jgi:hypothetical protein
MLDTDRMSGEEVVSSTEHSAERLPEAELEPYRELCDEFGGSFRQVGLVCSPEAYSQALQDPQTICVELGGVLLPLLVPIEHVDGYDIARSKQLTGTEQTFLLTLPPILLGKGGDQLHLPNLNMLDASVIVESPHLYTEVLKEMMPELLSSVGTFVSEDFIDPRPQAREGYRTASLSIYDARYAAKDENGEVRPARNLSFKELFAEELPEIPQINGKPILQLFDAPTLANSGNDLISEVWQLCADRFDWLGEYHPVSIEDTKEFFMQILLNKNTNVIIRNDEQGEPASVGLFMDGVQDCFWLEESFLQAVEQDAARQHDRLHYFFGIVNRGEDDAGYARDIMALVSRLSARDGGTHRLVFESTNISSQYIPTMVRRYIRDEGLEVITPIKKLDQIDYWFLRSKPELARSA